MWRCIFAGKSSPYSPRFPVLWGRHCYGNISTYCIFVYIKVNMYFCGSGVLVSGDILTCIAPWWQVLFKPPEEICQCQCVLAIEETRRSSLVFTDSTRIG